MGTRLVAYSCGGSSGLHARACYRIPFSCRPVRAGNHETPRRLAAGLQPVKPGPSHRDRRPKDITRCEGLLAHRESPRLAPAPLRRYAAPVTDSGCAPHGRSAWRGHAFRSDGRPRLENTPMRHPADTVMPVGRANVMEILGAAVGARGNAAPKTVRGHGHRPRARQARRKREFWRTASSVRQRIALFLGPKPR